MPSKNKFNIARFDDCASFCAKSFKKNRILCKQATRDFKRIIKIYRYLQKADSNLVTFGEKCELVTNNIYVINFKTIGMGDHKGLTLKWGNEAYVLIQQGLDRHEWLKTIAHEAIHFISGSKEPPNSQLRHCESFLAWSDRASPYIREAFPELPSDFQIRD